MRKLMGGGSNDHGLKDEDFNKASALDRGFKPISRKQDPRFGEVSILRNPATKETLYVKEKKFNDKAEMAKAILATRTKLANQTPYNLKLLDYSASKQSELCSTIYILRQFYEFHDSDLRHQFTLRSSSGTLFTPTELLDIALRVAKADPRGLHGDISPINILFDKINNLVKLVDRSDELPSNSRTLNIQKNKITSNQALYQSPKIYANLKNNNLQFDIDGNKEDAFSLGLILLELGNLKAINNIYDSTQKAIDASALAKHLADFKVNFAINPTLVSLVEGLTRMDEAHRLGIIEFINILEAQGGLKAPVLPAHGWPVSTVTTSPIPSAIGIPNGPIEERVTRIDTTITTTPIPAPPMPSIYNGMNLASNAFYEKPNLPPVTVSNVPKDYKYTPPAVENAPLSKISVSRTNLMEIPGETKTINTVVTGNYQAHLPPLVQTEYNTNKSFVTIQPTTEYSRSYTNIPSAYATYTPAPQHKIVLEPEFRREIITAAPIIQTNAYTASYIPSTNEVAATSYIQPSSQALYNASVMPSVYNTIAHPPPTTIRKSYTRKSVSVAPLTRVSTYPAAPITYVHSAPLNYEIPNVSTTSFATPAPAEIRTTPTKISSSYFPAYPANIHQGETAFHPINTYPTNTAASTIPYETFTTYHAPTNYDAYRSYPLTTHIENPYPPVNIPAPVTSTLLHGAPSTDYVTTSTLMPPATYISGQPRISHRSIIQPLPTTYTTYTAPPIATTYYPQPVVTTTITNSAKNIRPPSATNITTHYMSDSNALPVSSVEYARNINTIPLK